MEIVQPIPTRLTPAPRPIPIQVPIPIHVTRNPNAAMWYIPMSQSNIVTAPAPHYPIQGPKNLSAFFTSRTPPPPPPPPPMTQSRPNSACSLVSGTSEPSSPSSMQVEPRHVHHYKTLTFCGFYGPSSPLKRIRIWRTPEASILYDCVCGKRIPNTSLQKVKRHAYRHAVSSYTCQVCGKVFSAHWSLNAHCRIHKND